MNWTSAVRTRGLLRSTIGPSCSGATAGRSALVVVAALCVACGRSADDAVRHPPAPPTNAHDTSASVGASTTVTGADSTMLTVSALPDAIRRALRESDSTFVPFDPAKYPANIVAAAHRSPDEGLVVIRGDFQGTHRDDFAVAGMSGDSLRVLAFFQQPTGEYRMVDVYSVRGDLFAGSTPPNVPPIALERAPCEVRCESKPADAVVVRFAGDQTTHRPYHLVWVASLGLFASDEPID